jgi:glycogen debranching enzyme
MLMISMLSKTYLFMVSQFPCFIQVWSKNSSLKKTFSMLNLSSKSKTCQTLIQPLQVVQIVNYRQESYP